MNKKKKKRLKSLRLKDIGIDGIQLVYHEQSSISEKLFWAFIIGCALVVCVYMCAMTVNRYLESPTTTISYSVQQEEMTMPDIAICSSHPWNVPKLLSDGFPAAVVDKLIETFPGAQADPESIMADATAMKSHTATNSSNPKVGDEDKISQQNSDEQMSKTHPNVSGERTRRLYWNYGLRCKDSLLNCNFGGHAFDCCHNFTQSPDAILPAVDVSETLGQQETEPPPRCRAHPFLHPKLGTCMVMQDIPPQTSIHRQAGLTVLLRMGPDLRALTKYSRGYSYEAFLLEYALKYTYPNNVNTLASLRMHTNVDLKLVRTIRARDTGIFGTNCNPKPLPGFHSESCTPLCYDLAITDMCQCSRYGYLNGSETICNPLRKDDCLHVNYRKIENLAQQCIKMQCSVKLCEECRYTVSTSVALLTEDVFHILGSSNTIKLEELAMISVRYDKKSYHLEEEVPIATLVNLVSFLGGQIGLWLGGSSITLVLLLVLLLKKCGMAIARNPTNKTEQEDYDVENDNVKKQQVYFIDIRDIPDRNLSRTDSPRPQG